MSIVTATVSPELGVLSADTLVYSSHPYGDTAHADVSDGSPESFVRAIWCGDGAPPQVDPLGFQPKLYALPRLKAAIACGGMALVVAPLAQSILETVARDVIEVNAILPAFLQEKLPPHCCYAPTNFMLVGWSDRLRKVFGATYSNNTGWRSQPFEGHRFGVIPCPHASDYDGLLESADKAAQGIATEAFHVAVSRNIVDAYRAGKALRWMHFGGELLLARITPEGVTLTSACQFPGYAPLNILSPTIRENMAARHALAALASRK